MRDFFGLFMALAAFGGFGYFVYLKIIKPKMEAKPSPLMDDERRALEAERIRRYLERLTDTTKESEVPTVTRHSKADDKPQD